MKWKLYRNWNVQKRPRTIETNGENILSNVRSKQCFIVWFSAFMTGRKVHQRELSFRSHCYLNRQELEREGWFSVCKKNYSVLQYLTPVACIYQKVLERKGGHPEMWLAAVYIFLRDINVNMKILWILWPRHNTASDHSQQIKLLGHVLARKFICSGMNRMLQVW